MWPFCYRQALKGYLYYDTVEEHKSRIMPGALISKIHSAELKFSQFILKLTKYISMLIKRINRFFMPDEDITSCSRLTSFMVPLWYSQSNIPLFTFENSFWFQWKLRYQDRGIKGPYKHTMFLSWAQGKKKEKRPYSHYVPTNAALSDPKTMFLYYQIALKRKYINKFIFTLNFVTTFTDTVTKISKSTLHWLWLAKEILSKTIANFWKLSKTSIRGKQIWFL